MSEINNKPSKMQKSPLETFGRNINEEILKGRIDPVIGREKEIRRIIEIISRKSKNNPVLIGEPGVGKTAIVEGFVHRIVAKDVPANLLNKEVYELSLSSLIAGASFHGQFEERLNSIIKQVTESNGKIILFIDEIHQLVGTGKSGSGGSMDAANILKPMMARGEVRIIGATTFNEYRNYVEKDSALERRMQKIIVNEPNKKETITIMRGLKERWEIFHGVKILDAALTSAVNLSDRYITDRFLPDKAIDLVDEAAAKIKTEMHSAPVELDNLIREIKHLETEKAALISEKNEKSNARLQKIIQILDDYKEKKERLANEWNEQKSNYENKIRLSYQIEEAKLKIEKLQSEGKFEDASRLLYIFIPDLEKQIRDIDEMLKQNNNLLIKDTVTEVEIAEVISQMISVPLNKIMADEKEKILNLKKYLEKRVKGQEQALELITKAIIRSRAGINDPNRPIGSFLFLGPTGVGKTEVARTLAFNLFDNEKAMVKIDMSEYMEKHAISKLIGTAPGFVGYEQAGVLTESVKRKPYSVVLFDEVEKAHKDVLNLLLQIFDEGFIRDGQGKQINFKNTILIMTSNIGAELILENKDVPIMQELKKYMTPEFINRIDEIITFNPISEEVYTEIVEKQLEELQIRLNQQDIYVKFSQDLKRNIARLSYEPAFGARPIRRFVQENVESYLANAIFENKIMKHKKYNVAWDRHKKVVQLFEIAVS